MKVGGFTSGDINSNWGGYFALHASESQNYNKNHSEKITFNESIKLEDVSFNFGEKEILKNVNFASVMILDFHIYQLALV